MALRRIPCLLLLVAALAVAAAEPALAHGGNFRGGDPNAPNIDAPVLPGEKIRRPTTDQTGWLTGTWTTWWMLNRAAYLPDKRDVRRRAVATQSGGLFQVGQVGGAALGPWEQSVHRGARTLALPVFYEILEGGALQEDEVVGAALVALGRTARTARAVEVLERHARDPRGSEEVRESAVLGMGLLGRSDRALRLDTPTLERVRRFLLGTFDDGEAPDRIRAFACFSLGLLADQPYGEALLERDGRALTHALWTRLEEKYPSAELPIALLTALGMQPRGGVPDGVLQGLKSIAVGRGLEGRPWDDLRRSHALTAYVRLDGPGWQTLVLRTVRGTREHASVRAAAAIAIARRVADLDATERYDLARTLQGWLPREPQWFVEGLLHIALGCLLREDVAAGGTDLVEKLKVGDVLRRAAADGRTMVRPYTALALGLSVHGLQPTSRTSAELIREVNAALTDGLRSGRGADDVLGAFAVGIGLAGATSAHSLLLEVLQDPKRGPALRGHCALALGQAGVDTPAVREALEAAARERISPLVHAEAVHAQAILAAPGAAAALVGQLGTTRSRHAVAVVAASLGHLGDPDAGPALAKLARDRVESVRVRTRAVVALGLLFDPEARPSRVRMTTHANYPARTPSLTQLFNIQ